ncbi:MAG: hypothetical protein V1697_03465 [Candidatus Levyibacteriota bacterium]
MKYTKKGQLKIQQMAFMLMAITIFFVLAGMFAMSIKYSDVKKDAELIREKNSMLLVSKIANSPEFSCGGGLGGGKIDCVDADKAMILKENSEKYKNFWGVENIEIKIITSDAKKMCTLQNYPDCNTIKILDKETQGVPVSNFVSLCRKDSFEGESYNRCEVARIMVSYKLR